MSRRRFRRFLCVFLILLILAVVAGYLLQEVGAKDAKSELVRLRCSRGSALAVSPDESRFAISTGADISIYDLRQSPLALARTISLDSEVTDLAFSSGSSELIATCWDGSCLRLSVQSGRVLGSLQLDAIANALATSADRTVFAIILHERGVVFVDQDSFQIIDHVSKESQVQSVLFLDNGTAVFGEERGRLCIWDRLAGRCRCQAVVSNGDVRCMDAVGQTGLLAVDDYDSGVALFSLEHCRIERLLKTRFHARDIRCMGHQIIAACSDVGEFGRGNRIYVWNQNGDLEFALKPKLERIHRIGLLPSRNKLILVGAEEFFEIIDLPTSN